MEILLWIVFGLVVGLVAKLIMPGRDPGGIILTIVLGIVGKRVLGKAFANSVKAIEASNDASMAQCS